MDLSFIDAKTLFLIVHLFGIALGAGGAFISDLLFFKSIRDKKITKTEMGFLILGSHCVTVGLCILVISGAGLFSLDPAKYLASSKFLAKMTVVAILALNGIIFHMVHIPRLKRLAAGKISATIFKRYRWQILASGVISLVSWATAIVLGAFKTIPWEYELIISLYVAVLFFGLLVAARFRDIFVPMLNQR